MSPILIAADLVAIVVLVFGLFLRRHQRRDLIVAFLVVNVGVLALMATLSSTTLSVGVGLGLFGVPRRDPGYADAALACVQSSSFKPAQREGKTIPCVVRIPMLFVLKGL